VVCFSKLFSSVFDLLPLWSTWVCYLRVQGSLPFLWSCTKVTHQVWFVLEVKRSLKLFLQVLCATPVWPVLGNGLIGASCEAKSVTSLTGGHLQFKFSGKKSLSWLSRLFNPPSRRHQGPFRLPFLYNFCQVKCIQGKSNLLYNLCKNIMGMDELWFRILFPLFSYLVLTRDKELAGVAQSTGRRRRVRQQGVVPLRHHFLIARSTTTSMLWSYGHHRLPPPRCPSPAIRRHHHRPSNKDQRPHCSPRPAPPSRWPSGPAIMCHVWRHREVHGSHGSCHRICTSVLSADCWVRARRHPPTNARRSAQHRTGRHHRHPSHGWLPKPST
jgi:hypothetical protein